MNDIEQLLPGFDSEQPSSTLPAGASPAAAALPVWARTLGVFDLETTGVDTATARIVTATVAVLDADGTVQERSDWLVDPGVEIPARATEVHGITSERARAEGRAAGEAVAEIVSAVRAVLTRGIPLVVYNAPYDLSLLAAEAARHGVPGITGPAPIIDPLVIDKAVDRFRRGKRTLTAATAEYEVPLDDAHDAAADAIAAGRLAQAIARRYPTELAVTAAALHELQRDWCREQAESFQAYMRRTKDPGFTTSGAWPVR